MRTRKSFHFLHDQFPSLVTTAAPEPAKVPLVYISNPVCNNDVNCPNRQVNNPFETPGSSPSRLEAGASSSDDDNKDIEEAEPSSRRSPATPPLTPVKKLPAQACSVSLRDA
ncbi:hypothetical protein NL676_035714 [Syzygium grande]|nr:hypothetical protein NL676_035714 [Syzygium grande]